jgi:hypothetical protein
VVEHQLPKLRVVGSIPISRSMIMRELEEVLTPFVIYFQCYHTGVASVSGRIS